MFGLFRRKGSVSESAPADIEPQKGWLIPRSATVLLATPRRQRLLDQIWQRTSLSRAQFSTLYAQPIERYAELAQDFPASDSHHHAYAGGLLDHTLEIVAYALKLRQSHLLPVASPPENQAFQAEAWTAGVAYAALLHDVGKIAVDLVVECDDGRRWHPWHGPLSRPYRFRYREDRLYRLHSAASGLLHGSILNTEIMDWLSDFPELWASLLYLLAGQYERAGVLGEIVAQADQASVAAELGGDPGKARAAPKHALQRKLVDGLRHLARTELKLNQPHASDGWLTQSSLWLVSKTVCDKLRAYLLSQGIEGIPTDNVRVFSELQDHGIAQATPDGKAIWKATVTTSDGAWSHTFTLLKIAPSVIWDSNDLPAAFSGSVQPQSFGEPMDGGTESQARSTEAVPVTDTPLSNNSGLTHATVDGLLSLIAAKSAAIGPAHNDTEAERSQARESEEAPVATASSSSRSVASMDDDSESPGMRFCRWLRSAISERRMVINDAKALVHTVTGTAFLVTPGIFMRYAQEHPEIDQLAAGKMAGWQWAQKQFERLRIHRKHANGLNVWPCEVKGPRKTRRLHGYLLEDGTTLFSEIPVDNPYLTLSAETQVRDVRSNMTMRRASAPQRSEPARHLPSNMGTAQGD